MAWQAALAGMLGGAGSSALSSLLSYHSAKKLQKHQYELNQRSLKESPTASRLGYTKAGYNPLLALGSQGMGFSANSAGVPSDIAGGVSEGINSALSARQSKATVDNIKADTGLKNQQGETEKAKRVQMEFQNAMLDVQKHLADKDLSTYDRRFYSNLYEQFQRAENYRANSAVAQMNAETNRLNYQVNSANAATAKYNSETYRIRTVTQNATDIHNSRYGNPLRTVGYSWERKLRQYGKLK